LDYFERTVTADQGCRRRGFFSGRKNSACEQAAPSAFGITQEDGDMEVSVGIVISDPGN
jgi:hypothetical protein